MIVFLYLIGGWATPLKYMKVNWDDYELNIWENKMFQTTNQIHLSMIYIDLLPIHYLFIYTVRAKMCT